VKLGLVLPYEGSFSLAESIELTRTAEALGYDSVWMPEAWGTDAVSVLGALAASTDRIRLGTGILNVFSRTPALLGQTAATLDALSGGRFILGLGTSGPQVIAGWHGVPFDRPLRRMRETVEIVRQVVRRQPLRFEGEVFKLEQGLKLLSHPVRDRIPIFLATLTPAGVRLCGEVADGWMPTMFSPVHSGVFRPDLEEGARASGRPLQAIEIAPTVPLVIDSDLARARDAVRPWVALYVGGMGSRARNFYNQTVLRYGFTQASQIQDLYLSGKRKEALAAVPDALIDAVAIAGPEPAVRDRVAAFREAGVTTLAVIPFAPDVERRRRALELLASVA
jgi:F420-dependent oxidoreductase-like protein